MHTRCLRPSAWRAERAAAAAAVAAGGGGDDDGERSPPCPESPSPSPAGRAAIRQAGPEAVVGCGSGPEHVTDSALLDPGRQATAGPSSGRRPSQQRSYRIFASQRIFAGNPIGSLLPRGSCRGNGAVKGQTQQPACLCSFLATVFTLMCSLSHTTLKLSRFSTLLCYLTSKVLPPPSPVYIPFGICWRTKKPRQVQRLHII